MFERAAPATILAIAFVVLVIYAWPGYMSSDSAVQLTQARNHAYSDGHPPVMAALWTVVELFVSGPAGMLLIQASLFLVGLYWFLRRHMSDRCAAYVAAAVLVFPPVFAPMAVIWKDCQMAGFLMMGIALIGENGRGRRALGVASLAMAIALRYNAAAAALPIFVVLYPRQRSLARLASAVALWIAATGAAMTANHLLTRVHEQPWYYSVGPADITGTLANAHTVYSDDELRKLLAGTPLVTQDHIQQHARHPYDPTMWWQVTVGDARTFAWPTTDEQRDAISRAWWTLVRREPRAYLAHRWRVFSSVIALRRHLGPIADPVWQIHMNADQIGDPAPRAAMPRAIGAILVGFATLTPIDRPWIYLALALILLWPARRHPDALGLLMSGVLYELTLFPFAPSAEFRYSHWMIAATVIATVIFVGRHYASRAKRCTSAR